LSPHEWIGKPPKDDNGYLEEMTRVIFQAGLNWEVIRKKWPDFRKAFVNFSIKRIAEFDHRDIRRLMNDKGIVRNERKIKATVHNAQELLKIKQEFGSFRSYLESFGDEHERLNDLRKRFQHIGETSARIFLWIVGVKVTPTPEERAAHARRLKRES
jgi:DNA-3-methyladenine glycosylase I